MWKPGELVAATAMARNDGGGTAVVGWQWPTEGKDGGGRPRAGMALHVAFNFISIKRLK